MEHNSQQMNTNHKVRLPPIRELYSQSPMGYQQWHEQNQYIQEHQYQPNVQTHPPAQGYPPQQAIPISSPAPEHKQYCLWSPKDDVLLRYLKEKRNMGWREISMHFTNRTASACQFRWRRLASLEKEVRGHVKKNHPLRKLLN